MTQSVRERRWACLALVLLSCGCGQPQEKGKKEDLPLVQVGDHAITAGELLAYEQELSESIRPSGTVIDAHRDRLRGLVDRYLMLVEAESGGYREVPELQVRLEEIAKDRLVERVVEENIVQKALPATEEELRAVYEEYDLGWMIWPAHILSATEEEAWEIIRELEQGADFTTLARERSLADDADKGGDLRAYFRQEDAIPDIWVATYHLPVGGITRPVRTKDGWEVGKVIDKKRMSFGELKGSIATETRRRRAAARRLEFLDELKERFGVVYHGENVGAVLAGIQEGNSPGMQRDAALVSYQGGELRVGPVVEYLQKGPLPADSLAVFARIDTQVLPDSLMVLFARQCGYDAEPEFLAWKEKQLEDLLIEALYRKEVVEGVRVSAEEARQFYEERTELFNLPGEVHITEIQTETQDEALEVLQAIRDGQSFTELAREYAKRQDEDIADFLRLDAEGRRVVDPLRSSPYHTLMADESNRKLGQVQGPIQQGNLYAVFRLDKPIGVFRIPYPKVKRRTYNLLMKERRQQVFERFIASLREKHADKITWFDENLATLDHGLADEGTVSK